MKKNKKNPFFKILSLLFLIYVALFIAGKTGYYEKTIRSKTTMTSEQIAKFEQDVLEGKEVDIIDYLPEKEDYSNALTKAANVITEKLGFIIDNNAENVWEFFSSLFLG